MTNPTGVALVTGASKGGTGTAIAVRLAAEGAAVALVARDGGCRWLGCHIPAAWCEIDHLQPYAAGGATDLDSMVLLCSHHHHEKHRPGVQVIGNAHSLLIRLANGTVIDCALRRAQAAA